MTLNKLTHNFFLLMLFSPLISFMTFGQLGLYSSSYYFQLFACLLGVVHIIKKNIQIKLDLIYLLLLAYALYIIIWSFNNGYYDKKGIVNVTNAKNLSVFFILIIINSIHFKPDFIYKSIKIIKVTLILAFLASCIQVVLPSFLDSNPLWSNDEIGDTLIGDIYNDRRPSIFGFIDPNEVGLTFLPLVSILIGYLFYSKNKYYIFFLLIGGVTAFFTNTRYIMVGFLLIVMQLIYVQKISIKNMIKYMFLTLIVFVFLYFVLAFAGYNLKDWYNNRLLSEGSLKETTRYVAWINFQRFFPDNPFLGVGVHMTREIKIASNEAGSSQIHVGYLAHLVSYGIIGSIMLFGFWFLLARKLLLRAKKTNFYGGFFSFLVFLWANATLVSYSIFYYGLIFALIFDKIFHDHYLISMANKSSQNKSDDFNKIST